ncbi:MAG: hypothetical protein HZA08_12415 [Nitrospirae bacterium]|nr:hypothetical protein [Nitrospirota bacterium]
MKLFNYKIAVIVILLFSSLNSFAACPPPVKIISSQPSNNSKNIDPASPIILTWDKTTFKMSTGVFDYKTNLESINIAGGRYGLGTLLTTEWGLGGKVVWEGDKETITPEAAMEPGTQYKVWTYTYTSGSEICPTIGAEIVFVTAGTPPADNNPVRNFDLTTIYHGNETGAGKVEGEVVEINNALRIITVKEGYLKKINMMLYEGVMVMRNNNFTMPSGLKVGDKIVGEFMGGRLFMITATGSE